MSDTRKSKCKHCTEEIEFTGNYWELVRKDIVERHIHEPVEDLRDMCSLSDEDVVEVKKKPQSEMARAMNMLNNGFNSAFKLKHGRGK